MKQKFLNNSIDNSNVLYSITNYKQEIDVSVTDILTKFIDIIVEYMKLMSEKIIIRNTSVYTFIFNRGIDTLVHVFTMLFYYTKNLDLTFYHSQKAYFFYVEFIEQISDDAVTFLKLTSRDAITFVYKKTIYEINNEYRKNMKELTSYETKIFTAIDQHIYVYRHILSFLINNTTFDYYNKQNYIVRYCNFISKINELLNKNKNKQKYTKNLNSFVLLLIDNKVDSNIFINLIEHFITQINVNKKINEKNITSKIASDEISNLIKSKEYDKIIYYIFEK